MIDLPPAETQQRARRLAPAEPLPRSRTVLLLVDVINPLDFDGADDLAPAALASAERIAVLKQRLRARGVAAVYVNDNFGHWRSNFDDLLGHCRALRGAPAKLVRLLKPDARDLTVLKPRYSAFDQTPLELLLTRMATRELVLAGLAADLCVQFTAADAYVRGFRLWVPADCTAAESPARQAAALDWMRLALKARTRPAVAPAAAKSRTTR